MGTVPGGHGVPEPVPELAWFELPEFELFEFDDELSGVVELDDELELFDEFGLLGLEFESALAVALLEADVPVVMQGVFPGFVGVI